MKESVDASKEKLLEDLRQQGYGSKREVPELDDFQGFLKAVSRFLSDDTEERMRVKAIAALVHRVEVSKDKLNIHYYIGAHDTKKGLPLNGSPALFLPNYLPSSLSSSKEPLGNGSSTLTKNGAIRTQTLQDKLENVTSKHCVLQIMENTKT